VDPRDAQDQQRRAAPAPARHRAAPSQAWPTGDTAAQTFELYVGSLPWEFSEESLSQLFEAFGEVVSTKMVAAKRYGFVRFGSQAEAEQALSMNGVEVDGCAILVRYATKKPPASVGDRGNWGGGWGSEAAQGGGGGGDRGGWRRGEKEAPTAKEALYVKGLPSSIAEETVRSVFEQYGTVETVKMLSQPEQLERGPYMCAAIVRMGLVSEATWLVDNLNGNIPVGLESPLAVSYAKGGAPPNAGGARQRVTSEPVRGTLGAWLGSYGWVDPEVPIHHPDSTKNGGRIFIGKADIAGGKMLEVGTAVVFQVYSDANGLGAEELAPAAARGGGWPAARHEEASPTTAQGSVYDADWSSLLGDNRTRERRPREEGRSKSCGAPTMRCADGAPPQGGRPAKSDMGRHQGRIKTFDPEQQYGFIRCDTLQQDIFLPLNVIVGRVPTTKVVKSSEGPRGPLVEFDLEVRGGRPRASNAVLLDDGLPSIDGADGDDALQEELARLVKLVPTDAPPRVRAYLQGLVRSPPMVSVAA